jgi:hypothetical protein
MELACVLFEVRPTFYVLVRPLTTNVPVRPQVSPCEIRGRHSGTETGLYPSTAVLPVSIVPPRRHTYCHLGTNAAPTRRTNQQCSFGSR